MENKIECGNSIVEKVKNGYVVRFTGVDGIINDIILSNCTVEKLSRMHNGLNKEGCCNE